MSSSTAALPIAAEAREARRAELVRAHDEAVQRLSRFRESRLRLYGQVRRCLEILGERAAEVVPISRLTILRREADALAVDAGPLEIPEEPEATDPAQAWMEPEAPAETPASEGTVPGPSLDEIRRARVTLREAVSALDIAERATPDLHLAILDAEEKLRAFDLGAEAGSARPPMPKPPASD